MRDQNDMKYVAMMKPIKFQSKLEKVHNRLIQDEEEVKQSRDF